MYQRLKDRVEEIVAERFATSLIEGGIKQHCRHGYKSKCSCSACIAKRHEIATWVVIRPKYRYHEG